MTVRAENKPSLAAFATEVWAPRAKRRLAPKTWERDSLVLRKHVLRRLGDAAIADLDVEDLALWQEELERAGVGDPTIIKAISILSGIFREACRRPRSTWVSLNPVSLLEKPPARRRTPAGTHWVETDWRNYRSRHFIPALERVEAEWEGWSGALEDAKATRESVRGLAATRPYDLGRHTHSALMLASGMSLQRLARIQGHSIRVLDQAYAEELHEFKERPARIDPVAEICSARALAWPGLDPSTGTPLREEPGILYGRDRT